VLFRLYLNQASKSIDVCIRPVLLFGGRKEIVRVPDQMVIGMQSATILAATGFGLVFLIAFAVGWLIQPRSPKCGKKKTFGPIG